MDDHSFLDDAIAGKRDISVDFSAENALASGVGCASQRTSGGSSLRVFVAIATTGRSAMLCQVVERLALQTRPADGIIVVGVNPEDIAGVAQCSEGIEVALAARGLCRQRNAALDLMRGRADVVVFFDDDFVPANDFLETIDRLLSAQPDLVGLTGRLIGDGAQASEIGFAEAVERIDQGEVPQDRGVLPRSSLYGCNMVIRLSAAEGLRFDEVLPLYGWMEDVDFTYQLGKRGAMIETPELTGIHLGTRGGRTSGKRLGYSQIANIVYLLRKGTIDPWQAEGVMVRNILANLARSFWSEPEIDRRGRLFGNVLAFADWARGRIDPRRIETL